MAIIWGRALIEPTYSKLDDAISRGFDPHEDQGGQPVMAPGEWDALPSDHPSKVRQRERITGVKVAGNELVRFWAKVNKVDDADSCWLWTATQKTGYGWFFMQKINGRTINTTAHRWSYESVHGPIPEGMYVDHLCRTPLCVRPSHLEAVTPKENTLRGTSPSAQNARKNVCSRGHEFSDANTYHRPDGDGRQCRQCKREDNAERGRRRRAAARAQREQSA